MKTLEAIRFTRVEGLRLLDQRLLPFTEEWVDVKNAREAHDAIKSMLVRGAPAIGVTAALGMATDTLAKHHAGGYATPLSVVDDVEAMGSMLNTSRPTAVNLMDATALLRRVARAAIEDEASASVDSVVEAVVSAAEGYAREDVESNRKMGGFGADAVQSAVAKSVGRQRSSDGKVRVLTHCNTGSLATAGYGTALGVIRALDERGMLEEAIATETRPYNQGGRLTVYELCHDGLNAKLVCDSAAPPLMEKGGVDAVVVGADRIAANGDSANKIGTYALAIAAKHHGIPFFIAAPITTVDLTLPDGDAIPIEERSHAELTHSPPWLRGVEPQRVVAEGINCWNPAFDVAPAPLIAGIITELGVAYPSTTPEGRVVIDMKSFINSGGAVPSAEPAEAIPAGRQVNGDHGPLHANQPDGFQALDCKSVLAYVASVPKLAAILGSDREHWTAEEVGDGNINYVYIVRSGPGAEAGALVLKQALPCVRCVGESWPLPCSRVGYEAEALRTHGKCCPDFTPAVYHVDSEMALLAMEYVRPPSKILRYGLIEGVVYPHLGEQLGRHCADTLYKTSYMHIDSNEHRSMQANFCGNVEMCKLTEQVVFTEPYLAKMASNNRWTTPQLDDAAKSVSADEALKLEVKKLKLRFQQLAQALVHGDLHTGSIMADQEIIKVIDPEFAFFGPMGYDTGNVIAHLLLCYFSLEGRRGSTFCVSDPGAPELKHVEFAPWLLSECEKFWSVFARRMQALSKEHGGDDAEMAQLLQEVFSDTLGYCGCEMIRRIFGIAHVEDLEMIGDADKRASCEQKCVELGRKLIMERNKYTSVADVIADVKLLVEGDFFKA